jgi:hypothetical protein
VENGQLILPRKKRRLYLAEDDEDEVDDEDDEDEEDEEDEDDEEPSIHVDRFGIHAGAFVMPSRQLCDRVGAIVERIRRVDVRKAAWSVADVRAVINKEDSWLGVDIQENVIDAALYYTLPVLNFMASQPPTFVRVFWASEQKWSNARVDRISRKHGSDVRVSLTFTEEHASGVVTGADALFAYALI